MNKEYIEREATLKITEDLKDDGDSRFYDVALSDVRAELMALPAADIEPVRHGEWIEIPFKPKHEWDTIKGYSTYKCSECGRQENKKEPYCNCGAKMGEKDC